MRPGFSFILIIQRNSCIEKRFCSSHNLKLYNIIIFWYNYLYILMHYNINNLFTISIEHIFIHNKYILHFYFDYHYSLVLNTILNWIRLDYIILRCFYWNKVVNITILICDWCEIIKYVNHFIVFIFITSKIYHVAWRGALAVTSHEMRLRVSNVHC